MLAIVVIPMERKCLKDGLVAPGPVVPLVLVVLLVPVLLVLLVAPPPLTCSTVATVTPSTVTLMPAAFAFFCIAATILVAFIDALVRTGWECPAGNVTVNLALTLAAKRRAMTDKRLPPVTLSSVTLT